MKKTSVMYIPYFTMFPSHPHLHMGHRSEGTLVLACSTQPQRLHTQPFLNTRLHSLQCLHTIMRVFEMSSSKPKRLLMFPMIIFLIFRHMLTFTFLLVLRPPPVRTASYQVGEEAPEFTPATHVRVGAPH